MKGRDRIYLQTPEQWTSFLSAFVHELRTPVASLRMLTDLLAEAPGGPLGDPEKRYTENIREVALDIQGLVGDLAELARLLGGRAVVRPHDVILGPLLDLVGEAVRPRAWEGGIAITESLDPAVPHSFRTDPDRLRQTLGLLLEAAVRQARSEVFFRVDIDDQDLRITISSDGAAFPDGEPQAHFAPFGDGVRTARQRGGRSLALTLAHELAQTLDGTLEAENRGGRPAFVLSLPALPAAALPANPAGS
ncbi:MAG TPA: HAMP domain-containing sensor histidine kinase [Thermoanaerobaculia bacterium]|nr:HAMP domain-containing sensor histidine kinase [Thermoanaerobaculia bacterium]